MPLSLPSLLIPKPWGPLGAARLLPEDCRLQTVEKKSLQKNNSEKEQA